MRARFLIYFVILLPTGMLGAGTETLVCEYPAAAKGLSKQESRNSQATEAARVDPRAWFAKGQAALENGDLDAAEAAFRQVIAADPRAGAAYSNLGVIAMRRKQWDRAIALLQKAEKLEPKMAGIRLNIGLVEYRRGNYGAAIAPLASVVREQPDSQQARYLLGLCQVFTKHYAEAVKVLEPLWPEKSNEVLYLYTIDIAARESGQKELDEKILHQMIAAGAETPEFHLIMGKAFLNRYEVEEATRELERAAELNPNLPFLHFNLGLAYGRSGDYQRAYAGLAKLYQRQQKLEPALKMADTMLRITPDYQGGRYLRGRILMQLGREKEARVELAAAQKALDAGLEKGRKRAGEDGIPNPELTREPD